MADAILPLTLDRVCFDAGRTRLLHDLTFTLEHGPRTVILGPNGAGKSLTLRLCHGLLQPSAGAVRWANHGAYQSPRRQAMVFQTPVLLRRSVAANVTGGERTSRNCVRSKTCIPCAPAPSATIKA